MRRLLAQKLDRTSARRLIIQKANQFRHRCAGTRPGMYVPPKLFSARHIHQAVRVVRAHGLVSGDVLTAAGFRTGGRA